MERQLYSYTVTYRQNLPGQPLRTMVVAATDADDARLEALVLDPLYNNTVQSPRRGKAVETCRFCHHWTPIVEGTYTRIRFSDGIALVCDDCNEKADRDDDDEEDLDRYAEWQGTLVEVV